MIRTVWLALSCLVGLAAIAGGKAITSRIGQNPPETTAALDSEEVSAPAPKTDRLPAEPGDRDAADKLAIKTVKIVPAASQQTPAEPPTVAKKRWRSTYARLRVRKHPSHHRRHKSLRRRG